MITGYFFPHVSIYQCTYSAKDAHSTSGFFNLCREESIVLHGIPVLSKCRNNSFVLNVIERSDAIGLLYPGGADI